MPTLQRKIYSKLLNWKHSHDNDCLLIKGARQVGKTFVVDLFGQNEYKKYYKIDFFENEDYKKIFEGSLNPSDIYSKMSLYINNFTIVENDTLIFLDEIQFCASARTALKYLAMDKRCDVIAAGSMLGLLYKEIESIPVGYENQIEMHPLDFEEFLWANDITENAIHELQKYFISGQIIDDTINEKYLNLVNSYMVIGGMPEVVLKFIETKNYQETNKMQNKIINSYRDDITKYASNTEKAKILKCFDSITIQLSKEYTKFQYKTVEHNGSSNKFANSIEWLIDAGIVKKCYNLKSPEFPLKAFYDLDNFKLYMNDIGLLTCMYGLNTQLQLIKNGIKNTGKGGIFENLTFDILNKRDIYLYYYKNKHNSQEIEFVYESINSVIPVEVKSKNGKTISLNNFIEEYKPNFAYKIIFGNQGTNGIKRTIPYYMLLFI